jgi:hypothetical protein
MAVGGRHAIARPWAPSTLGPLTLKLARMDGIPCRHHLRQPSVYAIAGRPERRDRNAAPRCGPVCERLQADRSTTERRGWGEVFTPPSNSRTFADMASDACRDRQCETGRRRSTRWVPIACLAMSVLAVTGAAARQRITASLAPDDVNEAIRLAGDPNGAAKFLQPYIVQSRSGMGTGPLIGYLSTPFSRVVLAARAAQKDGKTFSAADVTADLIVPELHVIVLNQVAAYDPVAAVAQLVVVAANGPSGEPIEPTRRGSVTQEHYRLYAIPRDNAGALMVTFPLDVVTPGRQIRVTYTHVVRGSTAATNCKECVVPLAATRLR